VTFFKNVTLELLPISQDKKWGSNIDFTKQKEVKLMFSSKS
jgi:hypothetical protein